MPQRALCRLEVDDLAPDGWLHLRLIGELDVGSVTEIRIRLDTAVGSHPDVAIDISGLSFLGATGLSMFVSLHRAVEERGGSVVVGGPSRRLRRLFEWTGLTHLLADDTHPVPLDR